MHACSELQSSVNACCRAVAVKAAFLRAAELARSAGATRAFAEAATGFAVVEDSVMDLDGAADRRVEIELLQEAVQRVPARDRALRYRLARALCWLSEVEGDAAITLEQAGIALRAVAKVLDSHQPVRSDQHATSHSDRRCLRRDWMVGYPRS